MISTPYKKALKKVEKDVLAFEAKINRMRLALEEKHKAFELNLLVEHQAAFTQEANARAIRIYGLYVKADVTLKEPKVHGFPLRVGIYQ